MPLIVELVHRSLYRYDHPVTLGPQSIRLRPTQAARTPVLRYALEIDPLPGSLHWQTDPYSNPLARMVLAGPTDHLDIRVTVVADLTPWSPFDFLLDAGAETWPFAYEPDVAVDLAPFLQTGQPGPLLQELHAASPASAPTVQLLLDLAARVRDRVAYITRMEPGVWEPDRTLGEARGSCRDSAWLLIHLFRLHGIAARFVSGYLVQVFENGAPDNAELHAWVDAYLPGAGWIGLDATSGLLAAEGHIPLAASPLVIAAAPISGTVEPSGTALDTSMQVRRL